MRVEWEAARIAASAGAGSAGGNSAAGQNFQLTAVGQVGQVGQVSSAGTNIFRHSPLKTYPPHPSP